MAEFPLGVGEWTVEPRPKAGRPLSVGKLKHPGVPTAKEWNRILLENQNFAPAPRTVAAMRRHEIDVLLRNVKHPDEREALDRITTPVPKRPPDATTLLLRAETARAAILDRMERLREATRALGVIDAEPHLRVNAQLDLFAESAQANPERVYVPEIVQLGHAVMHAKIMRPNDAAADELIRLYREIPGRMEWRPEQPTAALILEPEVVHCRRCPSIEGEWDDFGHWHVDLAEALHVFYAPKKGELKDVFSPASDID